MLQSEIRKIRSCLIGTEFYIKTYDENKFVNQPFISISCNNRPLLMMYGGSFTVSTLKAKIEKDLSSRESFFGLSRQDLKNLQELLKPLYRDLKIDDILDN